MKKTISILIIALLLASSAFAIDKQSKIKGLENAMLRIQNQEVEEHLNLILKKIEEKEKGVINNLEKPVIEGKEDGTIEVTGKKIAKLLGIFNIRKKHTYHISNTGEVKLIKEGWDKLWKMEGNPSLFDGINDTNQTQPPTDPVCGDGICWATDSENPDTCQVDCNPCEDTDSGKNYYVKGTVIPTNTQSSSYEDSCGWNANSEEILHERICNGMVMSSVEYDCASEGKVCEDGACVEETQPPTTTCYDTDGDKAGYAVYSKGYAERGNIKLEDYCTIKNNAVYIAEALCSGGTPTYVEISCGAGCEEGACVDEKTVSCYDSDGGMNENVKGTTTFGALVEIDKCTAPDNLLEYSCSHIDLLGIDALVFSNFKCTCINGACVGGEPSNQTNQTVQTTSTETTQIQTQTTDQPPTTGTVGGGTGGGAGGRVPSRVTGLENAQLRVKKESTASHLDEVLQKVETKRREQLNKLTNLNIEEKDDGTIEATGKKPAKFLKQEKLEFNKKHTYQISNQGEVNLKKSFWDTFWEMEE